MDGDANADGTDNADDAGNAGDCTFGAGDDGGANDDDDDDTADDDDDDDDEEAREGRIEGEDDRDRTADVDAATRSGVTDLAHCGVLRSLEAHGSNGVSDLKHCGASLALEMGLAGQVGGGRGINPWGNPLGRAGHCREG